MIDKTFGKLASDIEEVLDKACDLLPCCREASIVVTKLQEAEMWAYAGMVRNTNEED